MKKIVFVSKYYPPSFGAASSRIYHFAKSLAEVNWDVHVLTEFPNYPTGIIPDKYKKKWKIVEEENSITIHRLYCYSSPVKNFFYRIINEITFLISSTLYIRKFKDFTFMVYTSLPFLLLIFSIFQRFFCSKPVFIVDIRDLYPDTAIELGVLKNQYIIRLLKFLEKKVYSSAELITTVSPGLVNKISSKTSSKVRLLTNGADTSFFYPSKRNKEDIRGELEWGMDDFIVLYTGTHGLMEKVETLIDTADILKNYSQIKFVLVGGGYRKDFLIKYSHSLDLKNVVFWGNEKACILPLMMSAADVGIVLKKNYPLCEDHLPVKMFEYAACGLPIIGSIHGMASQLIITEKIGWTVPPENPQKLSEMILNIFHNPNLKK